MEKELLDKANTKLLLGIAINWASKNDGILYHNIDHIYGRYNIDINLNDKEEMKVVNYIRENYDINEILSMAVEKADFDDIIKLSGIFLYSHHNWSPIGIYDWKYKENKENPYSFINPKIKYKIRDLESKNYKWHKSKDHIKHKHFRFWINRFLENKDEKIYNMRLFVENDTRCFETLHVGNNYNSDLFDIILQYILDNDIVPDPHNKELEVPDFVEKYNPYNTRKIKASGVEGGFWYLVYLTAEELYDIYKTKVNKRKLSIHEKALFSYINTYGKNPYYENTKFYIYIK